MTSQRDVSNLAADDDPSRSSAGLYGLFPPGVSAAELEVPGDPRRLFPEEARHVSRAVDKRVREFAGGRQCARRALAALGRDAVAIGVGAHRQPLWPPGVVGSITHTGGYCAAAAAESHRFLSVGIDCETIADVRADLWRLVTVDAELDWLRSLAAARGLVAGALVFAAKEAFYKCQHPLTGEFLGFKDVRVGPFEVPGDGLEAAFEIHPMRGIALAGAVPPPWRGRCRAGAGRATAAIAIPRHG